MVNRIIYCFLDLRNHSSSVDTNESLNVVVETFKPLTPMSHILEAAACGYSSPAVGDGQNWNCKPKISNI